MLQQLMLSRNPTEQLSRCEQPFLNHVPPPRREIRERIRISVLGRVKFQERHSIYIYMYSQVQNLILSKLFASNGRRDIGFP